MSNLTASASWFCAPRLLTSRKLKQPRLPHSCSHAFAHGLLDGRREASTGWQSLPLIAWRAIPAMALIAMLAGGLTIWTAESNTTPVGFGIFEEALSDTTNPGIEQAVLNQNILSRDDVLTIVVERSNRENKK